MSGAGLLVVGASQAGVQLATSVRERGWDEPITLVGAEPHVPYARPPLSKAFLAGTADRASLALRHAAFFTDERIDLHLGDPVAEVALTGGGGGEARTVDGRRLRFDRLALATGARPRPFALPGDDLRGVRTLRDLDDALVLQDQLRRARSVVVVGGGFVGLEVAGTAAASGCSVTVVEAGPSLMGRAVSPVTARFVQDVHEAAGVRVLTGTRPVRLLDDGTGAVGAVELDTGEQVPATVVVVGVGVQAADDLARAAGLACADGVVVDACSRASDGHTLAVGDCANLPDPSPVPGPHPRLRLESVDNAVEQARAAAGTVVGDPRPYRSVPWFWSDQAGAKLQIAGLGAVGDDVVLRPPARAGQHVALRLRQERVVAVECVNAPADFLAVRKALAAGAVLDRATVLAPGKLKDVLASVPA